MAPVELSLGRGRRSRRGEGNGQRILGPLTFSVPQVRVSNSKSNQARWFQLYFCVFSAIYFSVSARMRNSFVVVVGTFSQLGVANSAKRILTHILAISAANIRQRGEFAQQNTNKRVKRNCAGLTQKSINCFNLHINNNKSNNTWRTPGNLKLILCIEKLIKIHQAHQAKMHNNKFSALCGANNNNIATTTSNKLQINFV